MATRASTLALRDALLYAGVAAAWILLSDRALVAFANDSDTFSRLEIYKGWAFVVVTAAMLYVALRRQLQRFEDEANARRQTAERLAAREQHLNTILRTTLDGFWLVDRAGRFLEVNEAYCAMTGFSRDELLRMRIADLDCAETEDEVTAHIAQVMREGRDRFETRHRRKDGSVIEVEVGVAYVDLSGGRFVVYCRDLTGLKRTQRLMQHQELLLREAGEIAHLGGWEFDPVTFKGTWTTETARIHDVDPTAEVSAHLGLSCIQGESRKRIEAAIKAAIEHGQPYDLEVELVTPKGNRKWVRTICHPVVEGGRTVRVRGALQDITALKRTEAALRESEQQYRLLVDHASEAIYVVKDGLIQFANRKCAEWSGASQAELVGRSIFDFTPAEDRPRAMERHRALISGTGVPVNSEFRLCAPGGRLLWFAVSSVRITWKGGPATLNLATNITERKQTEEALRVSEERLRLAAEAAQIGTWDRDLKTGRLYWSDRQQQLMGYQPGTFPGTSEAFEELLHPDTLAVHAEQQARARTGDGGFQAELKYRLRDGRERWGLVCGKTKFDAAGKPVRIVGIQIDITERKQAEERLLQLSRAVEQSPVSIVITDTTGTIKYVNPKFSEVTGYAADEVRGKNPRLLKSGELSSEVYRDLWQTITQGKKWRGEFHNKRKNGDLFWEDASISPIVDGAGRITHFLAVKEDITARKLAEAERDRLEAQLRQAQKLEAIGTLAGGIAHDFNNILGAILGNAQLAVVDLGGGHPARESLDEIIKASRRAKDLVTQILAFSRNQPSHRAVTPLQPVIQEGLRLLRATLPVEVEIATSLAANTPPVLADTSQIHQVVVNLGTNAWHALEGRPGCIKVCLRGVTVSPGVVGELIDLAPGRYACLAVTDNGCGMDSQALERMFDPFYTTKAPGQGTGLGLAVVDGIVRKHEGRIRVTSTPGRGTTVRVYLPAAEDAQKVEVPAKPAAVPPGQGQRILFVDDEEPLVVVVIRLLARLGFEVAGFSRPAEALAAFRATPHLFDLAMTDFSMPGINGLQLAAELLALRPELPVVLCSGYITEALETEGRRIGVRRWLLKPTPIEELSKTLNQLWLESKKP